MSRMRLVQFLARAARMAPNELALRFAGREQSWSQLDQASTEVAGGLRALGVGPGDRVAILALNSDRYVELLFATWRLGAAVVPLNTRWAAAEIAFALEDSEPAVLALDDAFAAYGSGSPASTMIHIGEGAPPPNATSYCDLRQAGPPVEDLGGGGEDMAGIFYTGGTTGWPKGVMLAHTSLIATLLVGTVGDPAEVAGRSMLGVLPLFHLAGAQSAIAAAMSLRPLVILPTFDPVTVIETVEAEKIDALTLVPAMWGMLIDHPRAADADLSNLKQALYGASPMPEGVLRRVMARLPGVEFAQGYGQTETAGVVTMLGPRDHDPDAATAHRLRSAGRPIAFCEIKVVDEAGGELAAGEVGEVAVRGTGTMLGYWRQPEETQRTLRDGWVMTGDAGYLDEDGYLFLVDRTKDMIVSGGENVYSAETESALSSHPDVLMCAVIGVPDEQWGERVHAIVFPRPGAQRDADALIAHCRERLGGYKCPKSVEFRDEPLPLSAAGKVLKRELREPYWQGQERGIS